MDFSSNPCGHDKGSDIQCRVADVACDNECHFLPQRVSCNACNAFIGFTDFIF